MFRGVGPGWGYLSAGVLVGHHSGGRWAGEHPRDVEVERGLAPGCSTTPWEAVGASIGGVAVSGRLPSVARAHSSRMALWIAVTESGWLNLRVAEREGEVVKV